MAERTIGYQDSSGGRSFFVTNERAFSALRTRKQLFQRRDRCADVDGRRVGLRELVTEHLGLRGVGNGGRAIEHATQHLHRLPGGGTPEILKAMSHNQRKRV